MAIPCGERSACAFIDDNFCIAIKNDFWGEFTIQAQSICRAVIGFITRNINADRAVARQCHVQCAIDNHLPRRTPTLSANGGGGIKSAVSALDGANTVVQNRIGQAACRGLYEF